MQILIASDIFGKTPALEALVSRIERYYADAKIIDPYNSEYQKFSDENDAYSFFQQNIGFSGYSYLVRQEIKKLKDSSILLGFSIGASAIWTSSDISGLPQETKAFCFYGSQIRNYLNIFPEIEINLYFPISENHFDVIDLIEKVSLKPNVNCTQTSFYHGFMNTLSKNYDEYGYLKYIELINTFHFNSS
ncbi:MAG: hypothetical protein HOG03_03120 [Desulfobacula sp.]|jgi:hypothetical protein|uniref:hypothetical protein n=1 Tax=Desulfobacula sp. TaxID=2593537 RepID=UPI001D8C69A3|nr:hypothetical protein [Desulfobacula sp.]MBT3803572.1 hypothetical protein [Desulfobacula sp.]MBT4025710.1 hypothetical protein [Desulfobacula sp.]MBT4199180.1 hypothetical protein [Desulfobacula sp.]MBT4507407.1 hypothetical protein [Desulfobacula sp.]